MAGSIVGKILASVVLIVLCFIIGAQAAESAVSSAAIIAAIVGVVFMLIMGPRSWMLLFLLPPVIHALPLPGPLGALPKDCVAGCAVLGYWGVMWMMGYVRFTWRSLLIIDILLLALLIHGIALYIHRPVSVAFLELDTDNMGGKGYVYLILAAIYYLALSCIPFNEKQLPKVLNWSVGLVIVSLFIRSGMSVVGMGASAVAEETMNGRFSGFFQLGTAILMYLYSSRPIMSFLLNPLLFLSAVLAFGAVAFGGSRANIAVTAFKIISVSIIKKEIVAFLGIGALAYVVLFTVGSSGGLNSLPYGVQRAFTMVPGLKVRDEVRRDTSGTWNWRLELWALAFDKRTGYIQNYTFGDGFSQSKLATARRYRALMRGEYIYGQDLDEFATNGVWHNGIISTIHRMGYVGVAVISTFLLIGSFFMFRTCMALRGSPYFVSVVFFTAGYVAFIPMYCWGHEPMEGVFRRFVPLALIKVMYCLAREKGMIIPLFQRKRYVPKMIQEHEDRLRHAQQA